MGETRSRMVCGSPTHRLAELCKGCKRLRDRVDARRRSNRAARVSALQQGWDGEGFRCYYTGIRLIEDDHHDPRYLTFDHRTPRNDDDVVVCAACINDMKSDMTEGEFREVVLQLASRFSGGSFNEKALSLEHWRR